MAATSTTFDSFNAIAERQAAHAYWELCSVKN